MQGVSRSVVLRYGVAVLGVLLATGLRLLLDRWLHDLFPFATLFFAVLVVAWLGGFGPGLAATLLGAALSVRFLLPPRDRFAVEGFENQAGLVLYLVVSLGIAALGGAMRAARKRALANADSAARQRGAVWERQRQLELVADSAPVLIAHCDADQRFKFVNKPYAARFGLRPQDIVGRTIPEVLGPEAFAAIAPYVNEVLAGRPVEFEVEVPYRDLGTQHMLCAYEPERDGAGRVVGYVAAITTITERKRAERALREEARTTEALYRVGKALAAELELQKIVQTVTDESTALTGAQFGAFFYNLRTEGGESYTLYTLSGVSREAFARFPMPRNTAIFEPTFRGRGPVRLDDVTQDPRYGQNAPYHGMPEGHLPVRSYLAAPVVSRSGEVVGGLFFGHPAVGVFTERHELLAVGIAAQAAVAIDNARLYGQLKEAEARLAAIVNHSPAIIFLKDREGRYILVNRRFDEVARASGLEGPYLGRTDADLMPPALAEQFRKDDVEVMETRRVKVYEESADIGGVRWTGLTTKFPLLDAAGEVYAVCGINLDITERVRAEAALRESEQRFRGLMEQAPFSVQVFSPDGRTVRVNRAWEELWGVTLDQIADYNVLEDPQLEAKGVLPYLRRAFAGEAVRVPAIRYDPNETVPGRTRHADPLRWVAAVAYPLKDADGRVREVVLVHDDMTARVRAEEGLREGEERLRLALDAGRMGVWDWNLRTDAVAWSDNLEPLHGLAPGTFDGTFEAFQKLVHPDDRDAVNRAIARSVEDGSDYAIEFRNVWPDGSVRWMAGKGKVFREGGQPARMIGVAIDITDRKRHEQEARFLADASATLASLVDRESTLQKVARLAVPAFADWCTVDVVDDGGALCRVAVVHADPAKAELARALRHLHPPAPDAPQGLWNILRTGKSEIVSEVTDRLLAAGVADAELLRTLRELGLRSYIGVPLAARGAVLGVITFLAAESGRRYDAADLAVAEDLAHRTAVAVENARLYQEVREADRKKDEFLAVLAHELRNPLAPIRNALEILKLAGPNAPVAGQARDMAERQVHALTRMVDDLLDVSRIMRGKIELRRERIDLATVVARAVETARPAVEAEGHALVVALPDEPVAIDADLVRMAQVISNLLSNAAKYTDRGGRIELTASWEGGQAVVRVRDTGIGITPEKLRSVFDMFMQVDAAGKRAQGGLGIGLTVVRNLVGLHGGTVEAHSAGLGQGSEFTVRLPIADCRLPIAETGSSNPQSAIGNPQSKRVLVVDDNVDAAESLAMLLRLQGHAVQVAHDGPGGLRLAEAAPPEVAFLDVGMPVMTGHEVARRFRAHPALKDVLLVAVTGWGQEEDRRRTQEAGFDHHLVKPAEPDALRDLFTSYRGRGK